LHSPVPITAATVVSVVDAIYSLPSVSARIGTEPLPGTNRAERTVTVLALSGPGFRVHLRRSLPFSLHHPAKSYQKCVSCIWEGVPFHVPSLITAAGTWVS